MQRGIPPHGAGKGRIMLLGRKISWSETAAVNTLGFEVQMGAS